METENSITIKSEFFSKSHSLTTSEVTFIYNYSNRTIIFKINDKEYKYKKEEITYSNESIRIKNDDFIFLYKEDENNSFETWYESLEPVKKSIKKPDLNYELFKTAFQSDFIESEKYIFEKLKKHIENCKTQWLDNQLYAPIVVICQSSGYGKTKSLYEYARTNFTIFICLRKRFTSGFPARSILADQFIDLFKSSYKQTEKFLTALVQSSLEFYDEITKQNQMLENEKIPFEFRKYQPWLSNKNIELSKQDGNKISFSERVEELIESLNTTSKNLKDQLLEKLKSLTIVIDEAHLITNDHNEIKTLFHNFRLIIKSFFKDFNIVFVLISTNTSILDVMISNNEIKNSRRGYPFCELVYCDQLKSSIYENEFKKACAEKNLFDFITKRDPKTTIFYYGRPLWSSLNETNKEIHADVEIITLARNKLIRSIEWDNQCDKKYASLAILASRTTILSDINILNQDFTSNLISSYMATLFNTNEDCNVLSVRYVSEPILAEVAAQLMSKKSVLSEILNKLYLMISSTDLISINEISEIVLEILLLMAHDLAADLLMTCRYSRSITVSQFIVGLIGEKNISKLDLNLKQNMMEGIVAFNHFIQKIDKLMEDHLLNHFIKRCAAGRFNHNFPIFDHFIPVILKDNQLGMILIQVKNRKDLDKDDNNLEIKAKEINFKLFNKSLVSKLYIDLNVKKENTLKIFINLGNDHDYINFQHDTLIISGINLLQIDSNLKEIYKKLLNHSRNNMHQYPDKKVCKLVTIGCVDDNYGFDEE